MGHNLSFASLQRPIPCGRAWAQCLVHPFRCHGDCRSTLYNDSHADIEHTLARIEHQVLVYIIVGAAKGFHGSSPKFNVCQVFTPPKQ